MDFGWEVDFSDGGWERALGCHRGDLMHTVGRERRSRYLLRVVEAFGNVVQRWGEECPYLVESNVK